MKQPEARMTPHGYLYVSLPLLLLAPVEASAQATGYVVASCLGVDDTGAIQSTVQQANLTGGVVHLPASGNTCAISQPIVLQTGVVLEGGCIAGGSPITTGAGGPTVRRWCTRLLWVGSQQGWNTMVRCAPNADNCGVRHLMVDGNGGPTNQVQGIILGSNLDFVLEGVSVQNLALGIAFGGDMPPGNPTGNAAPSNLRCFNAAFCYGFYGQMGGQALSVASQIHIHGLSCWKYTQVCVYIQANTDDIFVDGGYINGWGAGGWAFLINPENVGPGTGANRFNNMSVELYPGDKFAYCALTNWHNEVNMLFFSGPEPMVQAGCLFKYTYMDPPNHTFH